MDALFAAAGTESLAENSWVLALITLTLMEIVLGIDNIVFIVERHPTLKMLALSC